MQRLLLSVLTILLLLGTGCDPTVDVFQPPAEPTYSLRGWLDVAIDTQTIRVEPLGDPSPLGAPEKFDARVLLEDMRADTTVALRDSFHSAHPDAYRDPVDVHTFWTTHPIRPSTTYRVQVQRDGNTITYATTTTPDNAPDLRNNQVVRYPVCASADPNEYALIEAFNIEKVAAARAIYPITHHPRQRSPYNERYEFNHTETAVRDEGHFDINIYYVSDLGEIRFGTQDGCATLKYLTYPYVLVKVAAGGPGWPRWRGIPLSEIARTDTLSNVQQGVGFVGGVYSDTIRVPLVKRMGGF